MAITHGHGNPDWTREETILALDLYFRLKGNIPDSSNAAIKELSSTLRSLPYHAIAARKESFRNISGVTFKLQNLRQIATGKGFGNVSKTDRAIWSEFGGKPDQLNQLATTIREGLERLDLLGDSDEDEEEFPEGRTITALHKRVERSKKLRKGLLKKRRKSGLVCDMCDVKSPVDAPDYYDAMFEVHHRKLISTTGEGKTKLEDVALLCANCHRVIHRIISQRKIWIDVPEARRFVMST